MSLPYWILWHLRYQTHFDPIPNRNISDSGPDPSPISFVALNPQPLPPKEIAVSNIVELCSLKAITKDKAILGQIEKKIADEVDSICPPPRQIPVPRHWHWPVPGPDP